MSISEIIRANGVFFSIAFAAISFAAVTLVVWRFIKNYHARSNLEEFLAQLEQELETGGGRAAFEFCQRQANETRQLLPKVFTAALKHGHQGKIAARDAIADCIDTELLPSLQSLLPYILLLIKTAPMVGLLGTVVGMIGAFQTIAGATKVDPSALAADIGMALFTTAEGLLIAIPLIFFYTLFRERVQQFELQLQQGAQEALRLLPRIFSQPES
ncbi:MAG: MotA/TolQ/ExbB proton channel family protein [Candidatus Anammoximicrobium sp.]|nr:MotA/TolQ/ExbB proton channel family protein [Candidatus Anammoximicrobium sp.]